MTLRFLLAQLFVVATDQFRVLGGDRIPINRNQILARTAAGEFLTDAGADFHQGAHHLQFHCGPIRLFAIASEGRAHLPGTITGGGHLIPQIRLIHHFFDVPQAIRPFGKIPSGNGSTAGLGLFRTTPENIRQIAFLALSRGTLPAQSTLRRARGIGPRLATRARLLARLTRLTLTWLTLTRLTLTWLTLTWLTLTWLTLARLALLSLFAWLAWFSLIAWLA